MTDEPRFLGQTASEVLADIQAADSSYANQAVKVDLVCKKARGAIEEATKKMQEELNIMIREAKDQKFQFYYEAGLIYRASLLVEHFNTLLKVCTAGGIPNDVVSAIQKLSGILDSSIAPTVAKAALHEAEAKLREFALSKPPDAVLEPLTILFSILDRNTPEDEQIYSVCAKIDFKKTNVHREAISGFFWTIGRTREFIAALTKQSLGIRQKVALFDDDSSLVNELKLNWLGTATDCRTLVRYLLDAGFLEGNQVNQYIAEHFLFKGVIKTPDSIRGLPDRQKGSIVEINGHLEIHKKNS